VGTRYEPNRVSVFVPVGELEKTSTALRAQLLAELNEVLICFGEEGLLDFDQVHIEQTRTQAYRVDGSVVISDKPGLIALLKTATKVAFWKKRIPITEAYINFEPAPA
jgi:hypothetical protein